MWINALRRVRQQLDRWHGRLMHALTARTAARLRRQSAAAAGDPATARLRRLLEAASAGDGLPDPPTDHSGFVMARSHAAFLAGLVRDGGVERVLEFGTGYSTLVLASALAERGGGAVTTVEQSPAWCEATLARAQTVPDADVRQVTGAVRMAATRAGWVRVYAELDRAVRDRGPYDLVVVDAPYWRHGREGALQAALPHMRPGARLVFDDAGRPADRWALKRLLAACPGLQLELYDEHTVPGGVAVMRLAGSPDLAWSVRVMLDSVVLAGLLAVARVTGPRLEYQP